MEQPDFVTPEHPEDTTHQSRREMLRRLGLAGVAAGIVGAAAPRPLAAQDWRAPVPDEDDVTPAPPPFAGVDGGLPPFSFPLESSTPTARPLGSIRWATQVQAPVLDGVAMASLRLAPGGLRELHWHLNAAELSYCLTGAGRIGIFAPDGSSETIAITPGSITFVPNGYTHYIENTGPDELHLVVGFTHARPDTTDFSEALPAIPAPLLAQTFESPVSAFPFLATQGDRIIVPAPQGASETAAATPEPATPGPAQPSRYSVTVADLSTSQFVGGTVQPLTNQQIPALEGITVFPLEAVPFGLREPHWHTNAGELNYCVSGHAQLGLIAPDGNVQTMAVDPGDIAYIPQNWFHYIANVGDEPLRFLIFFITPDARVMTINLSQTFGVVPAEILAASFGIDPALFAALPKNGTVGIAGPLPPG
ncbi:MAG: cupin domain-containing protein [Thermomicrobiales bacterium]